MNKRDLLFSVIDPKAKPAGIPAAFFLHFDPAYHLGQPAVDKHLEYFRYTGMDFVKIQFELPFPHQPEIQTPADWARLPFFQLDHYEPMLKVVGRTVKYIATIKSPDQYVFEVIDLHASDNYKVFEIVYDRVK